MKRKRQRLSDKARRWFVEAPWRLAHHPKSRCTMFTYQRGSTRPTILLSWDSEEARQIVIIGRYYYHWNRHRRPWLPRCGSVQREGARDLSCIRFCWFVPSSLQLREYGVAPPTSPRVLRKEHLCQAVNFPANKEQLVYINMT